MIILKSLVHKFHNCHQIDIIARRMKWHCWTECSLTYLISLLSSHGVVKSTRWFVSIEALTLALHNNRGARILRIPVFIIRVSGGGRAPSTIFAECDGGGGRRWRTPQLRPFVIGRVDPYFQQLSTDWPVAHSISFLAFDWMKSRLRCSSSADDVEILQRRPRWRTWGMLGWALDDEVVAEDVPRSDCWSGPAAGRMGRREGRRRKTGLHRPQHETDDMGRPPRSVSRGRSPSSSTVVVRIPWALLLLTTVVFILRISFFYSKRCLVNCGWKTQWSLKAAAERLIGCWFLHSTACFVWNI